MIREELNKALELTYKMREQFQQDNLDNVQLLAEERDKILHDSFGGKLTEEDKQVSAPIVQEIVRLNDEMIEMGQAEKAKMQAEIDKDLHASSSVKKYIDNMSD